MLLSVLIHCLQRVQQTMPRKTLLIVKLTSVLLFVASLQVSATGFSQITLSEKNASLHKVFKAIQKQTGFDFIYNSDLVRQAGSVDVDLHSASIEEAMKACLKDKPLAYAIIGTTVVIKPKPAPMPVAGQQNDLPPPIEIRGTVYNERHEPMQGVSVQLKGTHTGTTTDGSGNFFLQIPENKGMLVFSFVGYDTKEVSLGAATSIEVTLALTNNVLNEVVSIGYGTQKKINVTGSVSDIRAADIEDKPITQLSQVFAGQLTGISGTQASGEPGADQADILIRGRGTFSSAGVQPLVIVDGLPSSLNNIDPNSIESISILKDAASAAIYGSRAANGVILITTKRGKKGVMNVDYNGYAGWLKPDAFPDYVSTWQYAQLYNEALVNAGAQPLYSDAQIQDFKTNPLYSSVNHPKALFTSGSGFQTSHNIIFSGGNDMTTYFASLVYLREDGLVRENTYDRYTFTLNLDQKVARNLKFGVNLVGINGKSTEPVTTAGSAASTSNLADNVRYLYQEANLLPPVYPDKYPDGSYGYDGGYNSFLADLDSKSFHSENLYNLLGSLNLQWQITPHLKLSGKIGSVFNQNYYKTFNATFKYDSVYTASPAWLREDISNEVDLTAESLIEFSKTFGDHDLYLLGGYSQESNTVTTHGLSRSGFPTNETTVINAGSAASMQNSGNIQQWALRSFFGRLQYAYKDKYLFESNARYDGSSRFPDTKRYGFFPSFSGGWKVDKEPFFNVGWIRDLKLRASWGQLGNQNIGNYSYQDILSLGQDYPIGGVIQSGAALVNLANENISWETTRIIDYGADISFFNRKLTLEADYFNKKTSDILYKVPASSVLGFTPPVQNAGSVLNKGWELKLIYRNHTGNFSYEFSPNISFVHTEVLDLPGGADHIISLIANDYYTVMQTGQSMDAFYGYESDGLFADQNDITKSPTQPGSPNPGDIKYKDISGPNGVPDGQVDPTYDRTILGSYFPKYTFGATIDLSYKNFDLSMLFQGVAGVKGILSRWRAMPFDDGIGAIPSWQTDRWTADNPNPNAAEPRLLTTFRNVSSDFWVRDASYLKLKFLQAGYTFPDRMLGKRSIKKLRIYFSATNLFTVSHYYKGYDPDQRVSGDARYYPVTSNYTFGVNLGL